MLLASDFALDLSYQALMALSTAGAALSEVPGPWVDRIKAYVETAQQADDRVAVCVTDAKGDRSLPPGAQPDADAYVRIVEHRTDGVVIRGAKLHISGGSFAHDLLVMPTKAMKPGEEDYSICAAGAGELAGCLDHQHHLRPRHEDARTFPYSSQHHIRTGSWCSTTCSCPTSGSSSTGSLGTRRCSRTTWACGSGSDRWHSWRPTRPDGRVRAADREANGLGRVQHVTRRSAS